MIPWKEISATIGKVFTLSQETQKNKADIKQTRDELESLEREVQRLSQQGTDLTLTIQRVYYETQRLQDKIRHLREDSERRD